MTEVQEVEEVGGDPLLRVFARLAQEMGIEIGVTLNVSGSLVSGLLVGRDKWLQEIVNKTQKVGEGAATFGRAIQEAYEELDLNRPAGTEPTYAFLHLMDAKLLSGDVSRPTEGGMLWRGRISEVDGWTLGTFSTSDA